MKILCFGDSNTYNKEYKTLAQGLDVGVADAGEWDIPMTFDGVHFTEEGHSAFAEGLYNYLTKEIRYAGSWHEST